MIAYFVFMFIVFVMVRGGVELGWGMGVGGGAQVRGKAQRFEECGGDSLSVMRV